jgi:hypothetical protein
MLTNQCTLKADVSKFIDIAASDGGSGEEMDNDEDSTDILLMFNTE